MYGLAFKGKSTGFGSFSFGLLLVVSVFSFTYGQTAPRCAYGNYSNAGETCCLCPRGYYVVKHCTSQDPMSECEVCASGYTSEANSRESCEQCHVCSSEANLEVEKVCTSTSNAVCRCKSGHFCESGSCKACQPCHECKGGEKEPCTSNNDAVCEEVSVAGITVGVLLPVVVAGLIAFWLWKRKKLCFAEKKKPAVGPHETKLLHKPADLTGKDLIPFVPYIIKHLSWHDMAKVAYMTGMTKAEVERHQMNHPGNSEEQTTNLLFQWIEIQGKTNASNIFCEKLRECGLSRTADEIERQITSSIDDV